MQLWISDDAQASAGDLITLVTQSFPGTPLPMPNVLDGCAEEGPLVTPALLKRKTITKAQIQRCISQLLPRWDDEQLEAVVSMFKKHGLLEAE